MLKQYIREKINPVLLLIYKMSGITVHDSLLSCPRDIQKETIKKMYEQRPEISIFIETGTLKGDMVDYVKEDFKKVYSIELSKEYAAEAKRRFQDDPRVTIIQGDSAIELPKLLENIHEPCIFWLDSHYSYGDTAKADKITPVLEEIKPILQMNEDYIILIDDARLFIGRHNYPWLFKFASFAKKINKEYKISISHDIIKLTKKNNGKN